MTAMVTTNIAPTPVQNCLSRARLSGEFIRLCLPKLTSDVTSFSPATKLMEKNVPQVTGCKKKNREVGRLTRA